ncbi:hypothetical protein AHAS_Ahas18G0179900 [Arachis hypogaea]
MVQSKKILEENGQKEWISVKVTNVRGDDKGPTEADGSDDSEEGDEEAEDDDDLEEVGYERERGKLEERN